MNRSDVIGAALGDGGESTLKFIHEEILTRFGNLILNRLEDGAYVDISGQGIVVSTDAYVVDPPVFPGGDIGRLAVSGTINDLVATGATPQYLTLSLVIAEGFPLDRLELILDSAAATCEEAGVLVVAGDTKVVGQDSSMKICITTTGIGRSVLKNRRYGLADSCGGDEILVTGTVGDHSFSVLSQREGLGFEQRVRSDVAPLHELILPLLRTNDGIHALRDPTRGGLMGVLHDLALASNVDVHLMADGVPVRPEVRYGCEMLGLDPLWLANEGKMVLVVTPKQTHRVLQQLQKHPRGQDAAIVGKIQPAIGDGGRVIIRNTDGAQHIALRTDASLIPRLC